MNGKVVVFSLAQPELWIWKTIYKCLWFNIDCDLLIIYNQPINQSFSASTNPDSDDDVNGFEDINGGEIDYIKLAQL